MYTLQQNSVCERGQVYTVLFEVIVYMYRVYPRNVHTVVYTLLQCILQVVFFKCILYSVYTHHFSTVLSVSTRFQCISPSSIDFCRYSIVIIPDFNIPLLQNSSALKWNRERFSLCNALRYGIFFSLQEYCTYFKYPSFVESSSSLKEYWTFFAYLSVLNFFCSLYQNISNFFRVFRLWNVLPL